MTNYDWRKIQSSSIKIPEGVGGYFSDRITYKDYSMNLADNKWQIYDDRGTLFSEFDGSLDKRKAVEMLIKAYSCDLKVASKVRAEEADFIKELRKGAFPVGRSPVRAEALFDLRSRAFA